MTDRNDELLLALGWECVKQELFSKATGQAYTHVFWKSPSGDVFSPGQLPRPYDSVDDAHDCAKAAGLTYALEWEGKTAYAHAWKNPMRSANKQEWRHSTEPAEALASAIMKATGHE